MEKPVKQAVLFLLDIYQRYISPLKSPSCRFRPTCSQYAKEAILRHGAFYGILLSCYRLLRCNPWSKGGYDPVK